MSGREWCDDGEQPLVVTDYKSGKCPPKRFRTAAFFQLQIYALLLTQRGRRVKKLRLLFLGDGTLLERDVAAVDLERTATSLREVWDELVDAFRTESFVCTCGRCEADTDAAADAAADVAAPRPRS